MGELAPEFKQKIANSDGNSEINNQEKDVIFYVEAYARNMPPEYLNKLIDAIKEKLKNKQLNKVQIGMECENAIRELNNKIQEEKKQKKIDNRTVWEKIWAFVDQNLFSQIYRRTEGLEAEKRVDDEIRNSKVPMIKKISVDPELKIVIYQAIKVTTFEKEIKTTLAHELNSHALADYFTYLHNTKQLTPEILIQKFWWDTLLELGKLWKRWWTNPIAYTTLQNQWMGYIIDIVRELGSSKNIFDRIKNLNKPEELDIAILLLQEKEGSLKKKFKNELKTELMAKHTSMKENEANAIVEELLSKVLEYKGIAWLPKIYKIFDDYSKKYDIRIDSKKRTADIYTLRKTQTELDMAKILHERSKTKDPKKMKELDEQQRKLEKEAKEDRMATEINQKIDPSDIRDLVSWEKKMEQVVEELQKKDKEFNKEYTVWKKSVLVPEKTGTESPIIQSNHSNIPFQEIDNGKFHTFPLDRQSQNTDTVTIKRHDSLYVIQIGNDPENTTELPREKVSAYIQSLRFMEKLGLGYFLRNLPANKLSQILENMSKGDIQVNNKDGDFNEGEKKRILFSFGKLLGIKGIDTIQNSKDGQELFQWFFFTHPSIETILSSKHIINNWSLDSVALENIIKST